MDKEASDESSTDLDDLKNADWVRQQLNSDSASLLVGYISSQCLPKVVCFMLNSVSVLLTYELIVTHD